jgi:hypothetical protein
MRALGAGVDVVPHVVLHVVIMFALLETTPRVVRPCKPPAHRPVIGVAFALLFVRDCNADDHAGLRAVRSMGAPLEGGGWVMRPTADHAKGVIRARSAKDVPGAVARAILPQGTRAPGERSEPLMKRVGGWVSPLGDSLTWRGRLGWGVPRGENKAGEARRALCLHNAQHQGRAGGVSVNVARGPVCRQAGTTLASECRRRSKLRERALPIRRSVEGFLGLTPTSSLNYS